MQYPDTNTDMFVMEIDKQGNMIWDRHYGEMKLTMLVLLLPNSAILDFGQTPQAPEVDLGAKHLQYVEF